MQTHSTTRKVFDRLVESQVSGIVGPAPILRSSNVGRPLSVRGCLFEQHLKL